MIARSDTAVIQTPFYLLNQALKEIVDAYGISYSDCDAFEEIILKLMGIREKPRGCWVSNNANLGDDFCILVLTISPASAELFVKNLNTEFPDLKAKLITPEDAKGHGINTRKFAEEGAVISMKAEKVMEHLVPIYKTYLAEHPEVLDYYRSFNYNISQVCQVVFEIIVKKDASIDDLIKCLYAKLLSEKNRSKLIADVLHMFSLDLVNLVCSYLAIDHKDDEVNQDVRIVGGSLQRNPDSGIYTDLNIFYRAAKTHHPERAFARMINGCMPNSAEVIDRVPESKYFATTAVIKIKNSALVGPAFFSCCQSALEPYVKDETTVSKSMFHAEIIKLRKLKKLLAENKDYEKIPAKENLVNLLGIYINKIEQEGKIYQVLDKGVRKEALDFQHQCTDEKSGFNLDLKETRLYKAIDRSLTHSEIAEEIREILRSINDKIKPAATSITRTKSLT